MLHSILTAAALAMLGTAAPHPPEPGFRPAAASEFFFSPENMLCHAESLSLSEDGSLLVASGNEPEGMLWQFGTGAVVVRWGAAGPEFPSWGLRPTGGRPALPMGDRTVVAGTTWGGAVALRARSWLGAWQDAGVEEQRMQMPGTRFAEGRVGRLSFARAPSTVGDLRALVGRPLRAPLATPTATIEGLVTRTVIGDGTVDVGSRDWSRVFLIRGDAQPLPVDPRVRAIDFRDMLALPTGRGRVGLFAEGLVHEDAARPLRDPLRWPLYARAVVNPATGEPWLVHGPREARPFGRLGGPLARKVSRVIDEVARAGWDVTAVAGTPVAGRTVIVAKAQGSATRWGRAALIVFIDAARGARRMFACEPREPRSLGDPTITFAEVQDLPPAPGVRVSRFEERDGDHRIGLTVLGQPGGPGTVVWYRGGPSASLLRDGPPFAAIELAALGWRVVLVEYSGAANADPLMATRLVLDRQGSLTRDAVLALRWLDRNPAPGPLHVVADSFGALAASYLLERAPLRITTATLVAPYGVWRPAGGREDLRRPDARRRQEVVDQHVFGAPADARGAPVQDWMDARRAVLCGFAGTAVLLGADDPISTPAHWPAPCGGSSVRVFPETGHDVLSNPDAAQALSERIGATVGDPVGSRGLRP